MKTLKTIGMMIVGMTFLGTTTVSGMTNRHPGNRVENRHVVCAASNHRHMDRCHDHRTLDMRHHMMNGMHRYNRHNVCVVCGMTKHEIRRMEREMARTHRPALVARPYSRYGR